MIGLLAAVVDNITMKRILICVLVVAGQSAAGSGIFDRARLMIDSFGPVRIGMTVPQARRAAGVEMKLTDLEPGSDCRYLRPKDTKEIAFMIRGGKVSRIDVIDSRSTKTIHKTLSGIGFGDTEERAQQAYGGRLEVTQHKYVDQGHYLTLWSRDKRRALLFETDGKIVTGMRSGLPSSVRLVEGCS